MTGYSKKEITKVMNARERKNKESYLNRKQGIVVARVSLEDRVK